MKILGFCVLFLVAQTIWGHRVREMNDLNGFINEFPDTKSLKQEISRLPSTSPSNDQGVTEDFQKTTNQTVFITSCPKNRVLVDGHCRPKNKLLWVKTRESLTGMFLSDRTFGTKNQIKNCEIKNILRCKKIKKKNLFSIYFLRNKVFMTFAVQNWDFFTECSIIKFKC